MHMSHHLTHFSTNKRRLKLSEHKCIIRTKNAYYTMAQHFPTLTVEELEIVKQTIRGSGNLKTAAKGDVMHLQSLCSIISRFE